MPDDVVVQTPNETVSIAPKTVDDGIEVTSEWLQSTFDGIRTAMTELATSLTTLIQGQTQGMQLIQTLDAKVPSNLTMMISDQQTTITSLVNQLQETTRNIVSAQTITNTSTPPVQQTEQTTEQVKEEQEEMPESKEGSAIREAIPKRRRI